MDIIRIVMVMVCDFKYLPPAFNEGLVLTEQGYQVDAYALKEKGDINYERISDKFHVHRIKLWTRSLPKRYFFWMFKYSEYILRFFWLEGSKKASVYVAHNFDALIPVFFIAKLKRAKIVYQAHELYMEAFNPPLSIFWQWIETRLLKHVDATITPNDERAEIMFKEYGAKIKPVVVMNCPRYTPPEASTLLQDYLKEQGFINKFVVLFQGRLISYNGVEELIAAAQYFDDGIALVLLGPITPEYHRSLAAKIEQLNLGSKILIHEPVPYADLPKLSSSANIGVVLYRNTNRNSYFCAPNKLFEYYMAGLPVVSSNFPGLIRLVAEEGSGLVVEPDNPKQVAAAINYIHGNPEKADLMRKNALKCAGKYNWENESKKLLETYESILK